MTVRWPGLVLLALAVGCGSGLPPTRTDAGAATRERVPPAPSTGCAAGAAPAVNGERRMLSLGGEERTYLVDAPATTAGEALPVVLAFHGFTGSAARFRWWSGLTGLAVRERFVAIHADGREGVRLLGRTGRGWDIQPGELHDADFVRAVLDDLERERCIDRRRLFATGMSNGGFFASLLGCILADRLAAIAPVAGGFPLRGCTVSQPLPALFLYGSADRVVRPEMVRAARDWWAQANRCAVPVERDGCLAYTGCAAPLVACEGTQGHWWPTDAAARIWQFFSEHARR